MTRLKLIIFCFISALFLNNCSKILEPVSIFNSKQDITNEEEQEEFEINIKSLTFNTAKEANNFQYLRQLISTGNGSKANVLDEANFLKSNFPRSSSNPNYLLGIGDQVLFTQLNEFKTEIVQWPNVSTVSEYLLGVGDELKLTQSVDNHDSSIRHSNDSNLIPKINSLIETEGIIGSNGNVLLFGLGNILAVNRTLDDIRTEVRNILIRNGITPNFQLEISNFGSKKAYVISSDKISQTITLNNIPVTLMEIALEAGLSESNANFALVKLTRNKQEFRFTTGQLFNQSAPEIIIQDNDQIEIQIANKKSKVIKSVVGSKGNILLEGIGSIPAQQRTLNDVYEEINSILIGKGINPNIQLELTEFASKKAYFIQKNLGSAVIPLTSSGITLRELILKNKNSVVSTEGLSIITLKRNGLVFRMTSDQILDPKTQNIWIIDEDQIELEVLKYKPGQVFALSGAGRAQIVPIDPSIRETLADILFTPEGPLNNLMAKRSEVYLLRGKNPSVAYHLDAQNVSRILVAAKTELRPNDIVYVAERPIISFTRTLSEISPLRALLRDIQNNAIP